MLNIDIIKLLYQSIVRRVRGSMYIVYNAIFLDFPHYTTKALLTLGRGVGR